MPAARPPAHRNVTVWWLLALALVAGLLALVMFREPLGDRLLPQTRAKTLHQQAETALAQGHLSAADGSGARQLYEAALALDPDRRQAREGLVRVAQAALQKARLAVEQQRYDDAHRALQLARDLSVPRAGYEAVAEALRTSEADAADIGHLLSQAQAAQQAGLLDGDAAAALPLYLRILSLQPNHAGAMTGRDDVLADLLQRAGNALREADLASAAKRIHRVREVAPGHVGLPDLQARLLDAAGQRRLEADHDLGNGRFDAALAGYRETLLADPTDAMAKRGIEHVAIAWSKRAEGLAADFRFAPAQAALDQARKIAPGLAAVREAETRVQRMRATQATLGPVLTSGAREQRMLALLEQAGQARRRGDLLAPPGASAFDKLRAARALVPQHPQVRRAAQQLLAAVSACFERALRGNRLTRAGTCLDARGLLGEDASALQDARRRLASRWVAYGDERLGAGELAEARRALGAARRLDPSTAGLDQFAERVAAAMVIAD